MAHIPMAFDLGTVSELPHFGLADLPPSTLLKKDVTLLQIGDTEDGRSVLTISCPFSLSDNNLEPSKLAREIASQLRQSVPAASVGTTQSLTDHFKPAIEDGPFGETMYILDPSERLESGFYDGRRAYDTSAPSQSTELVRGRGSGVDGTGNDSRTNCKTFCFDASESQVTHRLPGKPSLMESIRRKLHRPQIIYRAFGPNGEMYRSEEPMTGLVSDECLSSIRLDPKRLEQDGLLERIIYGPSGGDNPERESTTWLLPVTSSQ